MCQGELGANNHSGEIDGEITKKLYCEKRDKMKCQTTELEIETLVHRIKEGDMDLQPDFQRGEIWTPQKKRKLIDSILRGWRIPPIHVVRSSDIIDEVLDGQQRLAAIRDFYDNIISVDGHIEPFDSDLVALDALYYRDLPKEWQRKFRQYSVNIVRLTEFKPEEPAELFYRLNQPTALTSAEQRNAYMGVTRDQVKNLSNQFIAQGASQELIGFSNSRLAYDEIISKFCYTVKIETLKKKITATDISEQYRSNEPFSDECIEIVSSTTKRFMDCIKSCTGFKFTFNKATLFSWLVFIRQNLSLDDTKMQEIMVNFEFCRGYIKGKYKKLEAEYFESYVQLKKSLPFFEIMLNTFNQRSSMGSTDALSIIYRDIIIHIFKDAFGGFKSDMFQYAVMTFEEVENMNDVLERISDRFNWGEIF